MRRTLWISLLLIASLLLAACGDSEPEPTATPTLAPTLAPTQPPPTTAPTQPPPTAVPTQQPTAQATAPVEPTATVTATVEPTTVATSTVPAEPTVTMTATVGAGTTAEPTAAMTPATTATAEVSPTMTVTDTTTTTGATPAATVQVEPTAAVTVTTEAGATTEPTGAATPSATVTGAAAPPATTTPQAVAPPTLTDTQITRAQTMMKAHTLIGYGVRSGDGEGIGDIRELMIDTETGQITYAILGVGGFLGLGETLIAVPWQALELAPDEPVFVAPSLLAEEVQNVPIFDNTTWVDPAPLGWDADIASFWDARNAAAGIQTATTGPMVGQVIKANALLEYGIRNSQNEDLGRVADLLIGMDTGHVLYIILARGGVLGMGEDLWAVPWQAINVDISNGLVLFGLAATAFDAAPRFDNTTWPDRAAAGWDESIMGYWQSVWAQIDTANPSFVPGALATPGLTITPATGAAPTTTTPMTTTVPMSGTAGILWRASGLMGAGIRGTDGEGIGDIRDLLVDLDNQQVTYAILGVGGFLGLGETLIAVPWQALTLAPDEPVFVLDATRADIENAPRFDNGAWTDPAAAGWDDDLKGYWANWLPEATDGTATAGSTAKVNAMLGASIQQSAFAVSPITNVVADFAIDVTTGKVVYAIIPRAGELSYRTIIVPWDALTLDVDAPGYTVALDAEQYPDAPIFDDFGWNGPVEPEIAEAVQRYWYPDMAQATTTPQAEATPAATTQATGTPQAGTTPAATMQATGTPQAQATAQRTPQASPTIAATLTVTAPATSAAPITDTATITPTTPMLMRARQLIGYGIRNPDDDGVGDVHDLLIDVDNGSVAYAILSVGGFLGVGDRLIAVPMQALTLRTDEQALTLDVQRDVIENAPVFDNDAWVDPAPAGWDSEVLNHWVMPNAQPAGRLVRMTALLDYSDIGATVDADDNDSGTVTALAGLALLEDIVFDIHSGQILYAVIPQQSRFIGRLLPVPLNKVILNSEAGSYELDMTWAEIYEAPRWDDLYNPQVGEQIDLYWQQQATVTPAATMAATTTPAATTAAATTPAATTTTAPQTAAATPATTPAAGTTPATTTPMTETVAMGQTLGAATLIGFGVRGADGEGIGDIRELLVDLDNQRVTYAVLGVGGFLGLGETLIAVPWQALTLAPDEPVFVLDVTRADIENAPRFDNEAWTDPAAVGWDDDLKGYWANWLDGEGEGTMTTNGGRVIKVTPLLEYTMTELPVGAPPLAERMHDLIVEVETGRVRYVVLAPLAETLVSELAAAVPMRYLRWVPEEQAFHVDLSPRAIRAAPLVHYERWEGALDAEMTGVLDSYWQEQAALGNTPNGQQ